MSTGKRRVGIFLWSYGLWGAPSLINFAHVLSERGYAVDVFTNSRQPEEYVHGGDPAIKVHVIDPGGQADQTIPHWEWLAAGAAFVPPPPRTLLHRLRRRLRLMLPLRVQSYLLNVWTEILRVSAVVQFARQARDMMRGRDYQCLVGAEVYGLAAATLIGKRTGIPVIYWCLELYLWRELHKFQHRVIKIIEWLCHRFAVFTIIQDDERASLLARDNWIPRSRFEIVPATARGPAIQIKTDYLCTKLSIPAGRKIILYAGSIISWAMCEELASAAATWPNDWALVIHGWGAREYVEEVRGACSTPGRLFLSLDVVPHDQLDVLISSADIGVALYRDLSSSHTVISAASNKLGHYLKCGLPVIVNDYPSLERLMATYECGVCVSSPREVGQAVQQILEDYQSFRANAILAYQEKYNFDAYIGDVIERIEALNSPTA